ncbi:MAG: zinc-binding dehydrogenase [Actinomycetota bacterium]
MKAAVLRAGAMVIDQLDEPVPGPGQVLAATVACGICGSDLHTVDHAHELVAISQEVDGAMVFDPDQDLVMGHELAVEVLEVGPGVTGVKPGLTAAAMPAVPTADGGRAVLGYDNQYPGGYAERVLVDPMAHIPVPNGLDPTIAALTEPMAVGLHAVNQSSITRGQAAIVVGAGPVGLAVIAALAIAGAEPIIASDLSPRRRDLAARMGAHVVVDPGTATDRRAGFALSTEAWAASAPNPTPPVVFEAVGVPGMLDLAMSGAPSGSELVIVGVCMAPDQIRPAFGIMKRLSLRFVLGWTPEEFVASLHHLADGRIDGRALVTDEVPIDRVPEAFAALGDPDDHIKILVTPDRR